MNSMKTKKRKTPPTEPKPIYMIQLKALMWKGCTEQEADKCADLLCDYLMFQGALPCGAQADVVPLTQEDVANTFPHYDPLDDDENEEEHDAD
jgi:hypothetical protein